MSGKDTGMFVFNGPTTIGNMAPVNSSGDNAQLSQNFGASNHQSFPAGGTGNAPGETLVEKWRAELDRIEKEDECPVPMKEFLRKRRTVLHERTTNSDRLATELYSSKIISDYELKKIKKEQIDYDKNDLIYDSICATEQLAEVLTALKKSENSHIIGLLEKWLE